MSFFKMANGKVVFSEYSTKHRGETIEQVARTDPNYLRWARRECTVGVAPEIFDAIDDAMVTSGVPFAAPKRKKSSPQK